MSDAIEVVARELFVADSPRKLPGEWDNILTPSTNEHYTALAAVAVAAYKQWEKDDLANEYGPSWHERLRLAQIVMRRGWI